jgi:hypothetical protein
MKSQLPKRFLRKSLVKDHTSFVQYTVQSANSGAMNKQVHASLKSRDYTVMMWNSGQLI